MKEEEQKNKKNLNRYIKIVEWKKGNSDSNAANTRVCIKENHLPKSELIDF